MKRKSNRADICPCCNSERMRYGGFELIDNTGYYPWECLDCGATGNEWYELIFTEHYNIYDKNGDEIEY